MRNLNQPNEKSVKIVQRLLSEHGISLYQPARVFVRRMNVSQQKGRDVCFMLDAPGGLRQYVSGGMRPVSIQSASTATDCAQFGFDLTSDDAGTYRLVAHTRATRT